MKAKEILNLCENDVLLTSDEIFSALSSYFIKKIKSCGLDVMVQRMPQLRAFIYLEEPEELSEITEHEVSKYLKELSKIIKNCDQPDYNFLYVRFVDKEKVWNRNNSIFYIKFYLPTDEREYFRVEISLGYLFQQYLENIEVWPELATKEALRAIYARVDAIAKSLRLVPFGE